LISRNSLPLVIMGLVVLAGVALAAFRIANPPNIDGFPPQTAPVPAEFAEGERLYNANCALCHGAAARGSTTGPALVHRVYEPSHHGDAAFQMAVRNGVIAHHWRFGNMPPQPQVTPEQVTEITAYVRWLQREVGIR
jgi:mono/diheme cytochrome c family protein